MYPSFPIAFDSHVYYLEGHRRPMTHAERAKSLLISSDMLPRDMYMRSSAHSRAGSIVSPSREKAALGASPGPFLNTSSRRALHRRNPSHPRSRRHSHFPSDSLSATAVGEKVDLSLSHSSVQVKHHRPSTHRPAVHRASESMECKLERSLVMETFSSMGGSNNNI